MNSHKKGIIAGRVVGHVLQKHDAYYYPGCSEPGYDDIPLLTGNWNHIPSKLFDFIEDNLKGVLEVDWPDQWFGCSICGKAVRQSGDCWQWLPSYAWLYSALNSCEAACEIACRECYLADKELQEQIIRGYANASKKALPRDFDDILLEHGFECIGEDQACKLYQASMHPLWPDRILADLRKKFEKVWDRTQICFVFHDKNQFDLRWKTFYKVELQWWDEDPLYPVKDWKYEVQNDDTRVGYHRWLKAQKDMGMEVGHEH
jgi:hypothetical protein